MSKSSSSYGEVLRSSSIMGGAQAINYLVGVLRTKAVAVLLGPAGVGLVGAYVAITTMVGTIAGLGINSSGVRDVAEAHGTGDRHRIASTVRTLRRASWVTGAAGWVLIAVLAWPLSEYTFGSPGEARSLALLGATLLLAAVDAGEGAIVQGSRRIGDLARRTMLQAVTGTLIAVSGYAWLGDRGIVPVLVATAATNCGISWWFSRRVEIEHISPSWSDTWNRSKRLMSLGLAFMWSALVTAGTSLAIRALIVRDLGIEASGMYQAAWALSGMFAAFILSAMGTDFYPRLTAVASDHAEVNRLVNQQTEIGTLLALPGVLGTLAFAPWVMRAFYSSDFAPATALLPWFVIGVMGRVVSWPMGFILLAKGASRWFATTETVFGALHLVLAFVLLRSVGLTGVAIAFALLYSAYTAAMAVLVRQITGFVWSTSALRLLSTSSGLVLVSFAVQRWAPDVVALIAGAALTSTAAFVSVRGIASRLGAHHRLVRFVCRLPGGSVLCGVRASADSHRGEQPEGS